MTYYFDVMYRIAKTFDQWGISYIVKSARYGGGYVIAFPWIKGIIAIDDLVHDDDITNVETAFFPWDDDGITLMSDYKATCKVIELYKALNK